MYFPKAWEGHEEAVHRFKGTALTHLVVFESSKEFQGIETDRRDMIALTSMGDKRSI